MGTLLLASLNNKGKNGNSLLLASEMPVPITRNRTVLRLRLTNIEFGFLRSAKMMMMKMFMTTCIGKRLKLETETENMCV